MTNPAPASKKRVRKANPQSLSLAETVIANVRKDLKSPLAACSLEDAVQQNADLRVTGWIKTGIWAVDHLIGRMRGIPLGLCGTIWGDENVGKSALSQYLIRSVQRLGGAVELFDFDGTLNPVWLRNYGCNLKDIILPDAATLEDAYDVMQSTFTHMYGPVRTIREREKELKALKDAPPLLSIIDTVAAAPVRAGMERDSAEDHVVGRKAAVLSEGNQNLRGWMRNRPAAVIFLNEVREVIGGMSRFGVQTKMPGGRSLRFVSAWILRLTRGESIYRTRKGVKRRVGFQVIAKTGKSKYGEGHSESKFIISTHEGPEGGPHPAMSNWLFLKDNGLIKPAGEKVGIVGMDNVGKFTEAEWPDVMQAHERDIRKMLRSTLYAEDSQRAVDTK